MQAAEGRKEVEAKNTPGANTSKTAALEDADIPTVRLSVETNLVCAKAQHVPKMALIE